MRGTFVIVIQDCVGSVDGGMDVRLNDDLSSISRTRWNRASTSMQYEDDFLSRT